MWERLSSRESNAAAGKPPLPISWFDGNLGFLDNQKKILERWDQSLYLMENPKQAGITTAIGTLC